MPEQVRSAERPSEPQANDLTVLLGFFALEILKVLIMRFLALPKVTRGASQYEVSPGVGSATCYRPLMLQM